MIFKALTSLLGGKNINYTPSPAKDIKHRFTAPLFTANPIDRTPDLPEPPSVNFFPPF